MASGGARNRSGPQADPRSGRSDARGYSLKALPAEGYAGEVPDFPLPTALDEETSLREAQVWEDAWRTPQACAWSLPSERWRIPTVALWVRVKVRCENVLAPATLYGQMHRLADQIGMTTAGLAEMGWTVAVDELGTRRAGRPVTETPEAEAAAEPQGRRPRRLR